MGILSLSLSPLTGHCLSQLGFLIVQAKQSKHQTLPFLLSSYKILSLLDLSLSLCSFFLSPLSLVHKCSFSSFLSLVFFYRHIAAAG